MYHPSAFTSDLCVIVQPPSGFYYLLVFKMKSTPAGITAFTLLYSAPMRLIECGPKCRRQGQYEAGMSQGFTSAQILYHIILHSYRKMLPAIISQFVTVIKDTSLPLLCYRPTRAL